MKENKNRLIYHWLYIMEAYKTLMLSMDPTDLGELIKQILLASTKDDLKNNTTTNKAVSYILTFMSEDPHFGHSISDEEDHY